MARWTKPPVAPNALERTAARAWRNRLTRCRQARHPRYTLNAGAVLLDAMARWIELPVAPNALERTAARAWPSGTRVKRLCALHTSARWKTIPQRVGSNYRSRPTRSGAQRRGPGLAAHGLNDSAHSIPQRAGKQYLSALENNTSARWKTIPQRVGPNYRSRPTRSSNR